LYHTEKLKGSEDGIKALNLAKEACPDLKAVLFGVSVRPASLPDWIDYRRNPPQDMLVVVNIIILTNPKGGKLYEDYIYTSWLWLETCRRLQGGI